MVSNITEKEEFNIRFGVLVTLVESLANIHPEVWDIVAKKYPEFSQLFDSHN
jgi:hypothetical protein